MLEIGFRLFFDFYYGRFLIMDTVIVIMQKNKKNGFLEKELASLNINRNENFIVNLFALEDENGKMKMHIKLSTDRDVADWEYSAVFDYYDTDIFSERVENINEVDDLYNPAWEIIFDYDEDIISMEDKIIGLLDIHKKELDEVYEIIKDKECEYDE